MNSKKDSKTPKIEKKPLTTSSTIKPEPSKKPGDKPDLSKKDSTLSTQSNIVKTGSTKSTILP